MYPSTNIVPNKGQLLDRGNIEDIRQAKRPPNVEITCNQNLSSPIFFPINVKKKGRSFYLIQEILGNLYDRTGVKGIRTPSIRRVGGKGWAYLVGLIDFLPSKSNWNFLIPIMCPGH